MDDQDSSQDGALRQGDRAVVNGAASVSTLRASVPSARRSATELLASPKPWNVFELEALTEWYFGKPLHLNYLRVWNRSAQYEVAERYNEYHGPGWLWSGYSGEGYDYSRAFWRHVVGELRCGGIAASSYGQTRHSEYEQERLDALSSSVAQAIEARRAAALDAVHESADPTGCAQGDAP